MNVSVKERLLGLFSSVNPPPISHAIDPRNPEVFTAFDAPVSVPLAELVTKWQATCPGPLSRDTPCHEVVCNSRIAPGEGEEACLFIHHIRALTGTLDPNESVKIVSSYMARLIPEVHATRQSMVDVGNAIRQTLSPLWVKAMLLLWGVATSAQVLALISQAVQAL